MRRARNSFRRRFDGDLMQPRAGVSWLWPGPAITRFETPQWENLKAEKRRGAF